MQIFNGTYTLVNSETGEHRTFSVKTQKDEAKFAPGERVVAILSGPNNEADYRGFAFVKEGGIKVWGSKLGKSNAPSSYEWYADMLNVLLAGKPSRFKLKNDGVYGKYEVKMEKRCLRCNRKLTNPVSLDSGIGPECAGR